MPESIVPDIPVEETKSPVENVSSVDLAAQVTALSAEREQLAVEKLELQDMLQRRQAEFDNFRRRTERDRADFAQFAGTELIRELLPVVDDFERASKADPATKEYAQGVEMIYNRLLAILKKSGLEPMDTEAKMFDPHLHQAVDKVHTDEAEDHAILGEFQKGYFYKGKMLRPAMVKVAVRP